MTVAAQLTRRLVTKEIRALSLAFVACLVAMVASGAFSRLRGFGTAAYFLGAAALGALSIGHEYSHRTLALLLSQPVRRERLLLVKLGVLASMLVTISAVAVAVVFRDGRAVGSERLAIGLLTILSGLFVAPWLTMLCRSAIAGTVFALALPGMLLTGSVLVYLAMYRHGPAEGFEMAVLWPGTLTLCAIGAVMTWRMFMRLEAIDGGGPDVHLPQWLRWPTMARTAASVQTKRHPVWLLVKKEVRLQQMALAVAGLYVLGWLTVVSLGPRVPHVDDVFTALTFLYGVLISMLIGSLASAEERQLGTLDWQLLLPVATWKQWAVKAGTASGLALLLAFGVPTLLAFISPAPGVPRLPQQLPLADGIALLTVGSLYASSLNTSGLRALVVSAAALIGAVLFVQFLVEWPGSAVFAIISRLFSGVPTVAVRRVNLRLIERVPLLLSVGFVLMVLRFALTNHRSADRAAARVWTQVIWMAFCLTIGITLLAAAGAFFRVSFI